MEDESVATGRLLGVRGLVTALVKSAVEFGVLLYQSGDKSPHSKEALSKVIHSIAAYL